MLSHLLVVALGGGLLREVPVAAGTISSGDSPVSFTALHRLPIFALGGPRKWTSALETSLQAPGTGFVHWCPGSLLLWSADPDVYLTLSTRYHLDKGCCFGGQFVLMCMCC